MKLKTEWRAIGRIAMVASVLTVGLQSPQAKADTLADALVGAYTQSGLLEQNRALLRAADEDVAIAGSLLRPIISWSGNFTRQFGNVRSSAEGARTQDIGETTSGLSLSAAWQLYDFGADQFRVDASKELVLSTRASLLQVEQSVFLRAVFAYFEVFRQQEFVELRINNLRLLQEELQAARDRFEVGEVTRTDVAQAEAALEDARSFLAVARRDLTRAQAEYTNVVGRAPGVLTSVPTLPVVDTDIESAQAIAVRNHPDVIQARHDVAATELVALAAGRDMYPTVSLSGVLRTEETWNSDGKADTGSVSLNFGGPIYRGGELSARQRRAYASRDAARGSQYTVLQDVQQDVVDAISGVIAARAVLVSSREAVRAAEVAFLGVREEANLGARTTLDVLDAEQTLLDARTTLISAQAGQFTATYEVLESLGYLTAQRLRLPVQIYDPAAYYNLVKNGPTILSPQGRQLDRVLRSIQVPD
ncbi:TolC family outer membrane protein [Tateyamaria pelophila]|uniref:TolC family outer membrane protein n=1 Tax=Tateyamaria pelophila TaxID=328415 RepID=UPI001CBF1191|nr:TolC family outer membrane protein [Tateyamaria pelophila]